MSKGRDTRDNRNKRERKVIRDSGIRKGLAAAGTEKKVGAGLSSKFSFIVGTFIFLILAIIMIKIISFLGGITNVRLTDEGFEHNPRYSDHLVIQGIDVSEHQNKIHWKKVKSSGADFVFVRAAYRKLVTGELTEDAYFKKNIKNANKAGLMVGAYIFSQAVNTREAEEEADYLVKLVKRYDIDLPLVIDYEIHHGGRLEQAVKNEELFAASHFNDITEAFCRRVEKAGFESAIYGNYDMFKNYMDASLIEDDNVLWVAQYGGKCDFESNYMFWQVSDSSAAGGISGNVDQDFWYIKPGEVYPTHAKGKKKQISIGECQIEFDENEYELKNHRAIPEIEVEYNGKDLKQGRDYEVSFVKNTEEGTGYAIVRGIKKYKDWTAAAFKIEK